MSGAKLHPPLNSFSRVEKNHTFPRARIYFARLHRGTHPISRRRRKRSRRRRRQPWSARRATVHSTCSLDYSFLIDLCSGRATTRQSHFGGSEGHEQQRVILTRPRHTSPLSSRTRSPRSWRVDRASRHASSAHHRNPSRTDATQYDAHRPSLLSHSTTLEPANQWIILYPRSREMFTVLDPPR